MVVLWFILKLTHLKLWHIMFLVFSSLKKKTKNITAEVVWFKNKFPHVAVVCLEFRVMFLNRRKTKTDKLQQQKNVDAGLGVSAADRL